MNFGIANWNQISGEKKEKLCYMDTGSFVVYKKAEDISVDISKDFDTRFVALNYELGRSLPM